MPRDTIRRFGSVQGAKKLVVGTEDEWRISSASPRCLPGLLRAAIVRVSDGGVPPFPYLAQAVAAVKAPGCGCGRIRAFKDGALYEVSAQCCWIRLRGPSSAFRSGVARFGSLRRGCCKGSGCAGCRSVADSSVGSLSREAGEAEAAVRSPAGSCSMCFWSRTICECGRGLRAGLL